jgi:DNA-nicking Smr family endonuclease
MTASNTARPRGDRALWQEAVRDVVPLRPRNSPIEPTAAAVSNPDQTRVETSVAGPSPETPPLDRFGGIDRANAERLKRGLRKIDATLDLHGMTQVEAHRALAAFIAASHDAGRRCLLVVTGRGLGSSGPGVLKRSVPRWLEEPELRRRILAIAPAQPRHGGSGAAYVLLRRPR